MPRMLTALEKREPVRSVGESIAVSSNIHLPQREPDEKDNLIFDLFCPHFSLAQALTHYEGT